MLEADRKTLLQLVRYIAGKGPARFEPLDNLMSRVRAGDHERSFPRAAIATACGLGVILADGDVLRASGEAQAFLRRALLEPEEAFQEQHRVSELRQMPIDGVRRVVRVNATESPLGAIGRLKEKSGQSFLPEEAIAAGERLHADFTRGQLQPRMTMSYEPRLSTKPKGTAGGTVDLSDAALQARVRVARAMEAVGPELCGVALDVCCFEKGLETVERERQWPARSAKLMLRTALMALARHYAPPQKTGRQTHAWGAEGYRPDAAAIVTGPKAGGQPRP
ncbi:DUF6456 domain-containing protein [Pararhizobium gei]|uniref:DUF6456 domain-containing protein n=1 Tax=Pararhizobium gei TaxID=1395951 RepID=UPI0023DA3C44|nr:DUF6456 domain-containing protein [Rhizobium gei]